MVLSTFIAIAAAFAVDTRRIGTSMRVINRRGQHGCTGGHKWGPGIQAGMFDTRIKKIEVDQKRLLEEALHKKRLGNQRGAIFALKRKKMMDASATAPEQPEVLPLTSFIGESSCGQVGGYTNCTFSTVRSVAGLS
jgi:hypothetical protein